MKGDTLNVPFTIYIEEFQNGNDRSVPTELVAVEAPCGYGCEGCFFDSMNCSPIKTKAKVANCCRESRDDNLDIVYVETDGSVDLKNRFNFNFLSSETIETETVNVKG